MGAEQSTGNSGEKTTQFSVNNQSVLLEDGVRGSFLSENGKLTEYLHEDAKTLHEGFMRGMKVSDNGPCLGTRTGPNKTYEWMTYGQVYERAKNFGCGLLTKGMKPCTESFLGIFSKNIPEWVIAEQACNMFSMVVVPLYDTLGIEACVYIINKTEMTTVVCDISSKVSSLLDHAEQTPTLRHIVCISDVTEEQTTQAAKLNIELIDFKELEVLGSNNSQDLVPPKPSDLATICFTSGTTGMPKGVMLTHGSIIANVAAVCLGSELAPGPSDSHISYLPLAHMFERDMQCMAFQHGMHIGFYQGDVKLLMDDLQALRPTIFAVVPRLLNRLYDKVMAGVSESRIKQYLFSMALESKKAEVQRGIIRNNSIWDTLVFRKVQTLLGGNVKFTVTGSAPLAENVLTFVRCAFGCPLYEAYGQTELTAGVTITIPRAPDLGIDVGPPLSCNIVKLVDVPDMDYFVKDGKGEVCAKGTNIMLGYFKEPEKTKETIDEDGWVHTGDIGQWTENGALKIIDRKKHIFKLSQGEYIAPEKIENIYVRSPLVAQMFVDGNSLQSCLVGIAVPDPEVLPNWAAKQGIEGSTMQDWCSSEVVKAAILKDILEYGKKAGLNSFEQVKDICLHNELFSVENDLLTPTFKAKRPQLRKYFAKHVEEMYKEMEMPQISILPQQNA